MYIVLYIYVYTIVLECEMKFIIKVCGANNKTFYFLQYTTHLQTFIHIPNPLRILYTLDLPLHLTIDN
jgi:hypothetical protein